MKGSMGEADPATKGHIPLAVIAFMEAFGNEWVDHFHRTARKEECYLGERSVAFSCMEEIRALLNLEGCLLDSY